MESSAWMMCMEVRQRFIALTKLGRKSWCNITHNVQNGCWSERGSTLWVLWLSHLQGTNRYFQRVAAELGLDVSFADCTKLEKLKSALKANTKVSQRIIMGGINHCSVMHLKLVFKTEHENCEEALCLTNKRCLVSNKLSDKGLWHHVFPEDILLCIVKMVLCSNTSDLNEWLWFSG